MLFEEFTNPENQYAVESFMKTQRQFNIGKDTVTRKTVSMF